MKKLPRVRTPQPPAPGPAPTSLTIAHTLAQHQSDPKHHFHSPAHLPDGRAQVATGARLQRVRARAHD